MPLSPQTLEEKPYNLCLNCAHIGKICDGPNFLAMTTERWCEWSRLRKEYLGWTNAHLAELSGISKISVDRIMSGNVKDLRNTTMQAVTKALINGSWGQYPCAMAALSEKEAIYVDNPTLVEKAENAIAQCDRLRAVIERKNIEHKEDLEALRAADQRKIDFLKEQIAVKDRQMDVKDQILAERHAFIRRKDRAIAILSALLAITLLVIIAALVIDHLNPDLGFFWVS